jgi:AbrB family looped-hinge helix DNA binding protein
MDRAGRLVIPAAARAALRLQPGQEFEVRVVDGWLIEIEPVDVPLRLVEEEGLLVLEPEEPVEPLTDQQVREAIERDRADREERWV